MGHIYFLKYFFECSSKRNRFSQKFKKKFLDEKIDRLHKEYVTSEDSGATLTDNEIKDIMKVIESLENRGILLKGNFIKITIQEGGFPSFVTPLITAGLPLMKNVLKPLSKNVLLPFKLTAGLLLTGTAVQKKIFESGMKALIISNEEMKHIIKIVKSPEESGLLIKRGGEMIEKEVKEQKVIFIPMFIGTLAACVLGNILRGPGVIRAGEGTIRVVQNF